MTKKERKGKRRESKASIHLKGLIRQNGLWVSVSVWRFETTEVGICMSLKARVIVRA